MQRLTEGEEQAIVNRLLLLDSRNVPADKQQVMKLGNAIYHARSPTSNLGERWYYKFRERHKHQIRFVVCTNKEKERSNAEDWHMMVDFYTKVFYFYNLKINQC